MNKYEATVQKLQDSLHREPTRQEIAEELKLSLAECYTRFAEVTVISFDGPTHFDSQTQIQDRTILDPEFAAIRGQDRDKLAAAIRTLPTRWQRILHLYYFEELTMKKVGSIMHVNESRVSQICKESISRLQVLMGSPLAAKAAGA